MIKAAKVAVAVAVAVVALTVSFGASSKPRDVPDIPNTGGPHGVALADLPDIPNPGDPPPHH